MAKTQNQVGLNLLYQPEAHQYLMSDDQVPAIITRWDEGRQTATLTIFPKVSIITLPSATWPKAWTMARFNRWACSHAVPKTKSTYRTPKSGRRR